MSISFGGGPTPSPTAPFYVSSFESYASNSDVSGDGVWRTGVNYNAFVARSGSTDSGSTGPPSAYVGSYYVYCETSSPNRPGAYFDLQTYQISEGVSSVSFSYMAYGSCIGTMYLQGSTDSSSWSILWTKSGNLGQTWSSASVSPGGSHTYLRFLYIGGSSYTGDFALDFVSINAPTALPTALPSSSPTPGPTSPPPTTSYTSYTSSFESYTSNSDVSGDGLWQTGVTYKAFVVNSGSTGSVSTGPSSAYSGTYYIYCETTTPNYPGAYFDLQSYQVSSGISSVSFFYLAYGGTIGTMYVQGSTDGSSWSSLWTKSGNLGRNWYPASVTVGGGNTFLRFLYIGGSSYTGDFALDYVSISTGSIPAPTTSPSLSFAPTSSRTPSPTSAAPTATPTIFSPVGVQLNYDMNDALHSFVDLYWAQYNEPTTSSDIEGSSYSQTLYPYMCVGAYASASSSTAALAACGLRSDILTSTSSLTTAFESNGAYWYYYSPKSFGFSATSTVSLGSADTASGDCSYRLSWRLDQGSGGYRAGCTTGLDSDLSWYKRIIVGTELMPSSMPTFSPTPSPTMTPQPTPLPTPLPTSSPTTPKPTPLPTSDPSSSPTPLPTFATETIVSVRSSVTLTGLSAAEFDATERAAFKSSLAASITLVVSADHVQNVNATNAARRRRRLIQSGQRIDVSYTLQSAMATNGYATSRTLFVDLVSQLSTAVESGTLETNLVGTGVFPNVSVDNSTFTTPANFSLEYIYAPTSNPTTAPPSPVPTTQPTTVPTSPPVPSPTLVPTHDPSSAPTPRPTPLGSFDDSFDAWDSSIWYSQPSGFSYANGALGVTGSGNLMRSLNYYTFATAEIIEFELNLDSNVGIFIMISTSTGATWYQGSASGRVSFLYAPPRMFFRPPSSFTHPSIRQVHWFLQVRLRANGVQLRILCINWNSIWQNHDQSKFSDLL